MKAPGTAYDDAVLGKDPQPAHMDDYVHTTDDNGGVHINSGIPNHAFYLAATELGGYAWEKAGRDLVRGAARSAAAADGPVQHVRPDDRAGGAPDLRRRQRRGRGRGARVGPGRRPDQPAGARRRTPLTPARPPEGRGLPPAFG